MNKQQICAKNSLSRKWLLRTFVCLFFLYQPLLALADSTQVFNVKDFGALADGGVYDCDREDGGDGFAIQQTLDAAKESGGGIIYLPAGIYFFNQPLIISDQTTVMGDGPETILRRGKLRGHGPQYVLDPETNAWVEKKTKYPKFFYQLQI